MKYLAIVLSLIFMMSCASNPYQKNYTGKKESKINTEAPIVLETTSMERSEPYLKANGYKKLGEAKFFDYYKTREVAEEHAESVNASVVVVDRSFKDNTTAYVPRLVKTFDNPTKTFIDVPYTLKRYNYHATYWVKDKDALPVSTLMTTGFKLYGLEK